MTELNVFKEDFSSNPQIQTELKLEIAELLMDTGIRYLHVSSGLPMITDQSTDMVNKLQTALSDYPQVCSYPYSRLVVVDESHDNLNRLRLKYLSEHRKEADEAYLVVDGSCLLSLHLDDQVYQLRCDKGDFIELPADIRRWIDFGEEPRIAMLKFSHVDEDAVAVYTGDKIADHFPRLKTD